MALDHLFDAELEYRPGMEPIASEGEGRLIGSGDGAVTGDSLNGAIRWTLFEQPGEFVCAMNPTVVIETKDGAQIRVEGRGYARRERRDEPRWRVAAALRFDTRDRRYAWLDGALGFSGKANSTPTSTAPTTAPTPRPTARTTDPGSKT